MVTCELCGAPIAGGDAIARNIEGEAAHAACVDRVRSMDTTYVPHRVVLGETTVETLSSAPDGSSQVVIFVDAGPVKAAVRFASRGNVDSFIAVLRSRRDEAWPEMAADTETFKH